MKIIYDIKKIGKFNKPVVALGVFDGVHIGHRHILTQAVKKARAIKGTSVVITFYPHPQAQQSLYSLNHRLKLISELGVDVCVVIRFDYKFSKISAEDFVKEFLVKKLGAKFIYIGDNFRFGKSARGDSTFLHQLSKCYGYKVRDFPVIKIKRRPVSSTYIRRLITGGELVFAKKLLQRPVTVLGTVVKGISLARKLGFPTANIDPHHEILPPSGVYAVKILFANKTFRGVCNIGKKPTVTRDGKDKHVEVHIFGFNEDIYGKDLEIQFLRKIRDEVKFSSLNDLSKQIKKDIKQALRIFSNH